LHQRSETIEGFQNPSGRGGCVGASRLKIRVVREYCLAFDASPSHAHMTIPSRNQRELLVVMPVYNEEAAVEKVAREWLEEIERWTKDFVLLAINDGSKDGTARVLDKLQAESGGKLQALHRENRGHGQSCLQGYRHAIDQKFSYVMQIDSDWQCDPRFFYEVWSRRGEFDVIYGKRVRRDDGWRRVVASWVLKAVVWLRSGTLCADPNVPYRLMRTEILPPTLGKIPADFFLANVALAVLLRREKKLRHGCVPIHFRDRYGGQPTVRMGQFGFRARQLIKQLGQLDRPVANPNQNDPNRRPK
jgi:dolichol-phosphate mannosyltransferase